MAEEREPIYDIELNRIELLAKERLQHYSHEKYWKMREKTIHYKELGISKLLASYYLYRIKRMDAFNNASLGTHLGYGTLFKGIPLLPHGIFGIIITHNAIIGKNCTIFHQVTIGEGKNGAPVIGDNCMIGPGAKIIGGIHIGNNVMIGANCVIVKDVPDNATVVVSENRIINHSERID